MAAPRVVLHSDCNCFYAACEMMKNPRLRNIPFAVCGDPAARKGIVLTANYPAKRLGVRTGMVIWEAQRVCKDLVMVPADYDYYLQMSEIVFDIYDRFTHLREPFGLDESWLDISGYVSSLEQGVALAHEISGTIKRETGLTVSIGVADNKVWSKLASDMRKPDFVTALPRERHRELVWPVPVEDLLYVGRKTQAKLHNKGVRVIKDIVDAGEKLMTDWLGKHGAVLYAFALGFDLSGVAETGSEAPIKTIGNSTTAIRDLITMDDIKIMTIMMAESVGSRMKKAGFASTTVEISLKYADMTWYTRQRKLALPTDMSWDIVTAAMRLFDQHWNGHPLRGLGVRAAGLVPADIPQQLTLDYDPAKMEKMQALENTVLWLRKRFGNKAVQRGVMYTDTTLSRLDPERDHTIHPPCYFNRGGAVINWRGANLQLTA